MAFLEKHIYLASRSARRRDILKQMGVSFEMLLLREGAGREADFDEAVLAGEDPAKYASRIARLKAEAGWARLEQRRLLRYPVLAADTAVAIGDDILGKPTDREDAVAMLKRLSGTTHYVHSAVAVKYNDRLEEALRDLIDETLHEIAGESYWKQLVPPDIRTAVERARSRA